MNENVEGKGNKSIPYALALFRCKYAKGREGTLSARNINHLLHLLHFNRICGRGIYSCQEGERLDEE